MLYLDEWRRFGSFSGYEEDMRSIDSGDWMESSLHRAEHSIAWHWMIQMKHFYTSPLNSLPSAGFYTSHHII
jgi:hypothetical protein